MIILPEYKARSSAVSGRDRSMIVATQRPTGHLGATGREHIRRVLHRALQELDDIEGDETAWWLLDILRPRRFLLAHENPIAQDKDRRLLDRWWDAQGQEMRRHCHWLKRHGLAAARLEGLWPIQQGFARHFHEHRLLRKWQCHLILLTSIHKFALALCLVLPDGFSLERESIQALLFRLSQEYEKWEASSPLQGESYLRLEDGTSSQASLARLTHDFRKPLANLILNHQNLIAMAESVERPLEANPDIFRDALRRFGDQLQVLDGYTHDLLYLLTGKRPAKQESEDTDLKNTVEKICKQLDAIYSKHKKIQVHIRNHTETQCRLHRRYSFRILFNLIENAYKFSAPIGLVHIDLQKRGNWIRIDIEDNGAGFKLWDEDFELSKLNLNESGGSWGIGLASSYELAQRMGGRLLRRRPRHGTGAHFLLVLPNNL